MGSIHISSCVPYLQLRPSLLGVLDIRVTGNGGIEPMKSKSGVKMTYKLAAGKFIWKQQGQIGATSLILGQ